MQRGDDGWWRISVPLEDGDYEYKFQVKSKSYFAEGEMVTIADPRSLVVSDDFENTCIHDQERRAGRDELSVEARRPDAARQ